MATKAEHITSMKSANATLNKNTAEYNAQIDEWATNAAAQDAKDTVVNDGGSHADYKAIRKQAYIDLVGDIPDQFDYIYHNGLDAWKAKIKEVKDKYPKP